MNPLKAWVLATAVPVLLAGPAAGQTERARIESAVDEWEAAFRSGDPAALANVYSDDAMLLPPNHEVVRGREAMIEFFHGALAAGIAEIDTDTMEIEVTGSSAHRLASFRVFGTGRAILDRGKAVEIWKKVRGEWKLHRDMWSSDDPLPAAAAAGEGGGGG